jgi:hypothetical protein
MTENDSSVSAFSPISLEWPQWCLMERSSNLKSQLSNASLFNGSVEAQRMSIAASGTVGQALRQHKPAMETGQLHAKKEPVAESNWGLSAK